jgi:predicted Zn finger-like uncharacterized protein
VKFLCDKCKTRYSIGDDRVRGKILKIRCKNCANVITVREGMDIPAHEPRHNPTQAIPRVELDQNGDPIPPPGALGAAFASQMSKPPPALEEEWYVSIDGNQEGPFSLGDAQRWVSSKPYEAELHCWSEGFDDWLPVDKVSHFRNLRKRPASRPVTVPPPIPRAQPRGDEPKPLFAATMASLEKAAGPEKPAATAPLSAKSNGSRLSPGAAALAAAFTDESTYNPEPTPLPAPVRPSIDNFGPLETDDNLEIGEVSRVVSLADIGNMGSRKNATQSNHAIRASQPAVGAGRTGMTGSVPALSSRSTGAMPRLSPAELGMNVNPALAAPGQPMPDESMLAQSLATKHRRGLVVLLTVSAVMVIGVVVAVGFAVSGGQEEMPMGLGGTRVIDTSRPEDIVRRQMQTPQNTGSAATTVVTTPTQKPRTTPRTNITTTQPTEPETGPGTALDPSEIEAMAAKYGEGTKRCYMRAQKGALGLEIGETKKIDVMLTIGKDGTVSEVKLSKHANNEFGQCLITRIKGWRFRESRGGTFQFALAFSAT